MNIVLLLFSANWAIAILPKYPTFYSYFHEQNECKINVSFLCSVGTKKLSILFEVKIG